MLTRNARRPFLFVVLLIVPFVAACQMANPDAASQSSDPFSGFFAYEGGDLELHLQGAVYVGTITGDYPMPIKAVPRIGVPDTLDATIDFGNGHVTAQTIRLIHHGVSIEVVPGNNKPVNLRRYPNRQAFEAELKRTSVR